MEDKLDILHGAAAIADYTCLPRKRVFAMIAAGDLPGFKIGSSIAARKSKLNAWLEALENAAA